MQPDRRPRLVDELDRLLPETLALLAEKGVHATFFVLGEVARRLPGRVRELAAAGHEVASHGELHLRVERWAPRTFVRLARDTRSLLEDLSGSAVLGFRAPEWSMRHPGNPRLRGLIDAGFRYDSSVASSWGSGRRANPRFPHELHWPDGGRLAEFPPLTWGGPARLPACGWTGRVVPIAWIATAARAEARLGGIPVMTFHPWELVDRPAPGEMPGLPRLFHDAGRAGYRTRLGRLLGELPWRPLAEVGGWWPASGEGEETSR